MISATLLGVEAVPVTVEVAVTSGIPGMAIVGMGDTAVQEARERVRAAIRSSGFSMPVDKVVVNLAPGDLKKSGSGFDLPIAIGILVATGQLDAALLEGALFVGELSLKGEVREYPGHLAFALCARSLGCKLVCASGCSLPIEGLEQVDVRSLESLRNPHALSSERTTGFGIGKARIYNTSFSNGDFKDIAGHEVVKRALQVATAGKHGVLLCGPPGSGKTFLASRVPSILPPLTERERLETAVVHSVAGEPVEPIIAGDRPFRDPHHSATVAGMMGGGSPVRPGEVTLAHNGVLFLDELAEFKSSVLQSLRQPIESGEVLITRARGSVKMPASFMLIAATNPCPCGYYGDDARECRCTPAQISKYQGRVGGPLMDRFQMQIDVRRLPSSKVLDSGSGVSSEALREGVMRAREFADWRSCKEGAGSVDFGFRNGADGGVFGVHGSKETDSVVGGCLLSDDSRKYLASFADAESLSGRSIVGLVRVARTIADMDESETIKMEHLAEAIGFRVSDAFGGA